MEQRALGEQRAVLCEAELAVTKPADSSLGASFIDVSDRRDIRVKLHLPRPSGPLADAGGAAMLGATVVMVNGEAVRSTAHLERLVLPLEHVTLTLALREPRRVSVCGDCDQLVLPSLSPLGPGSGSSLLREDPGRNHLLGVLDSLASALAAVKRRRGAAGHEELQDDRVRLCETEWRRPTCGLESGVNLFVLCVFSCMCYECLCCVVLC